MSLIRKIIENETQLQNLENKIERLSNSLSITMKATLVCTRENKQMHLNYQKINSQIEKLKSTKKTIILNNEYHFIIK